MAGDQQRPRIGVFTQTSAARKPVPWDRIAAGEPVWMKWKGGPVVARATVDRVEQLADCTRSTFREVVRGCALHDQDSYWASLPPQFHGMAIFLRGETWLDEPFVPKGKAMSGWLVFPDAAARERWMTVDAEASVRSGNGRGQRIANPSLRFLVFRRDSYTCQYCGRRAPEVTLHVDHVVPWSKGGHTALDNLRTACSACNLGKSTKEA